ncbi:uncharacterized protein LOC131949470 [Physella acuta]|uniref:uncharacterized protein LOC131949470 n=1 Tax=Physella acuta TaxID=109671 RepID=UPI0027DB7B53|nr:uncharacterized protein LOC131949470 [Physella acuta]
MDCIRNCFWILLSMITLIDAAPPTLEELTALKCNSDKPFKCLPYGVCYNADQFCVAGDVESCFPKNITTDQLENWCKTTGQFRPELMRDPKLCALACQARFPSLNLSNAVDQLVNLKCPRDRPLKCLPDGICHGFDEYCHAGQNKSCLDVTMSVDELKQWCQDEGQSDVTLMPDPACKFACQAKFPSLHHEALEKLANKTCPLERPLKCLPDGICHGLDEYCHHGVVTSCFNETMMEKEQLQWCIDKVVINVTSMPDKACQFACPSKYPNLFRAALDQLANKRCPQERPCKCLLDGVCHGYDEFCDAGRKKSCFDESMSENEILQWCRDIKPNDVSVFPQLSCTLACHARFHSLSSKGGENGIWSYLFTGLAVLVMAAAGVLVWKKRDQIRSICSRFWCKQETENPTPESRGGGIEENNDNKRNSNGEGRSRTPNTGGDIGRVKAQALITVSRDNAIQSDEANSSAKDPLLSGDLRESVPKREIQEEEPVELK